MNVKQLPLTFLLMLASLSAVAQTTLTGNVFDAQTTEALTGATVQVKGTNTGANTDARGEFSISYKGSFPVSLIVSYLGYETKQVELTGPKRQRWLCFPDLPRWAR